MAALEHDGIQAVVHEALVHGDDLLFLSLVGGPEVKALFAAYASGKALRCLGLGPSPFYASRPYGGEVRSWTAHLKRGVYHLVARFEDPTLYVGRPEGLARWLARRLRLPILPEWVPHLLAMPPLSDWRDGLKAYRVGEAGFVTALKLEAWEVEEVAQGVQKALREGRLPLPKGVEGGYVRR